MAYVLAVRERTEEPYSTPGALEAVGVARSVALAGSRGDRIGDGPGVAEPCEGPAEGTWRVTALGSPASRSDEGPAERGDPDDEDDLIDELGDEIAVLSAHLDVATHRLLELVARFDRLRGWERAGYSSCAHWLAVRTTIEMGAAREKVRAARALERLPLTSAAMARGEVSYSQVRALTRVAEPETEAALLELARGATTAQLERIVSVWRRARCKDEAEWERQLHESRTLSVFLGDDGLYVVRGRLMPEVGALFMRAIEAASDAQFREKWVPWEDTARAAAQRRADAVALLAERALAAGFGGAGVCGFGGEEGEQESAHLYPHGRDGAADTNGTGEVRADGSGSCVGSDMEGRGLDAGRESVSARTTQAVGEGEPLGPVQPTTEDGGRTGAHAGPCGCSSREAPLSGTRAERYQVMVHVDARTLAGEAEPPGLSELEDGVDLSRETSRRLACDAAVVRVLRGEDGSVLDVGRRTRTIPPALRRALEVRDRGCRFPGCGRRFTDSHHVVHWAEGGETSLSNCLLLCGFHHRLVHEGGWTVEWWGAGRPAFKDPRGSAHYDGRWQAPELPADPVAALLAENRAGGVAPGRLTATARWEREADVPLEVWSRAVEAVL